MRGVQVLEANATGHSGCLRIGVCALDGGLEHIIAHVTGARECLCELDDAASTATADVSD